MSLDRVLQGFTRFALCGLLFIGCAVCRASFAANPDHRQGTFNFSIPATTLTEALNQFAATVGATIIFDAVKTQGVHTEGLRGVFSAQAALQRLLHATAFVAIPLDNSWLVRWQPPPAHSPLPPPPNNALTPAENTPLLEETLVLARYSNSLQRALEQVRNAQQVKEVIYAEDIGKFPAMNIAEALKRLSAVSVIRDRGEALFISIRGLPSQFHLQTFNGHEIASNENVRTSEQFGRRFHYHLLPPELMAAVSINKTPQAADLAGGIGGAVNFEPYKPLQLAETMVRGSLEWGRAELLNKTDPRGSLLVNWVDAEQTLGLTVAASYTERSLRQDRVLNFSWAEINGEDLAAIAPGPLERAFTPGTVRPTLEIESRRRSGSLLSLQWLPGEHSRFELNYFGLQQRIHYREYSYGLEYAVEDLVPNSLVWRGNGLIGAQVVNGSVQLGVETSGIADSHDNFDLAFSATQGPLDYQLRAFVSTASSGNHMPIQRTRLRSHNDVNFTFLFPEVTSGAAPSITLQNIRLDDPAAFPGRRLEWRRNRVDDRVKGLAASADFHLDAASSVQFGVNGLLRRHDYQRRDVFFEKGISDELFGDSYFSDLPVDDFLYRIDSALPRDWRVPNQEMFWQVIDARLLQSPLSPADLQNSYLVTERVDSGFAQYNYRSQRLRANAGVRWVGTEQHTEGYRATNPALSSVEPVAFTRRYAHILPMANINWQFRPQLNWRNAVGKTLNRPNLQDLSPRLTLNSGEILTAISGNPLLEATTAWQVDSALEWYFAKQSFLSATLFASSLQHFIHSEVTELELNDEVYLMSSKTNGGRARVKGLELELYHVFSPFKHQRDNIGVAANYTLLNSVADYANAAGRFVDNLEDTAENTANLSLFYEAASFSARINYNWTDGMRRQAGFLDTARRDSRSFGSVDLHLSYASRQGVDVFFEVINATNQSEQEFVLDRQFASYSHYGRVFLLGVRARLF